MTITNKPITIQLDWEEAEALLWLVQQTREGLDETANEVRKALIFDLSLIVKEHHS
jgi:hypothetical protein